MFLFLPFLEAETYQKGDSPVGGLLRSTLRYRDSHPLRVHRAHLGVIESLHMPTFSLRIHNSRVQIILLCYFQTILLYKFVVCLVALCKVLYRFVRDSQQFWERKKVGFPERVTVPMAPPLMISAFIITLGEIMQ